ncbi:immunoglobulin-like domain-containing protein, partial [Vibrio sp. AND4]|uniref:immunoglobulin-like domain-containing protein n=1 Tax=Vibrio sp. AND4 TaxID=314289 RepID=UPI00015EF6A8
VDGVGWIAQNNDALKQEFIYYISDSLSNGTRGFHKIPHDKLVFGIPSNIDAAATGFVQDPQDLYDAFEQLKAQGQALRGVMTWSVNWDMGTNKDGQAYGEKFVKDYGPFVHGQTPPPSSEGEPVFNGINDVRVQHGSSFDPHAGVTASDKEDGDLTNSINVEGSVDVNTVGTYVLVYSVKDSDNNETKQTRTVVVYSLVPEFEGVANTTIQLGEAFDPMAGVKAIDAEDGDLTGQVKVEGSVDVNTLGVYNLVYRVTDSANQTATAQRAVTVSDGSGYPAYEAGKAYEAGEIVTGSDGNLYQCKPWPYTGWCANPSYAPGETVYWSDAWDKL